MTSYHYQYESEYPPNLAFDKDFKDFISAFYLISDTPSAHEEYTQQFSPTATLTMASKKVSGHEEILAFRKGMWNAVSKRSHYPSKVFPFGPDGDEVMIYGKVHYTFKDGKEVKGVEWAARGTLVKSEGRAIWAQYQVYLVNIVLVP